MNVVITGASSGIGAAYVRTFARRGHPVLAVARREERLQALCQEIRDAYGTQVHYQVLDLTSPNASSALYEAAVRVFPKVHVLINNAGMSPYQKFRELEIEHMRQTLALNVQVLTELCHLFMAHMLAHGEPNHVVNIGSVGGYAPLPYFSVYTGTKHYVRVFTDILHQEYKGSNIRVSAIHPGGVITEFAALAGQDIKPITRKTMLRPEELAEKTYPAILKGKRVVVPGGIYKLAALIGKLLPFPLSSRIIRFIYHQTQDKIAPTYSLSPSDDRGHHPGSKGQDSAT